jgi:hypothetical protein
MANTVERIDTWLDTTSPLCIIFLREYLHPFETADVLLTRTDGDINSALNKENGRVRDCTAIVIYCASPDLGMILQWGAEQHS